MNDSWCGITALKPLRRRRHRFPVSRSALGLLAFAFLVVTYPAWSAYAPAALIAANNLSDLASAPTARTNLGLGTAATQSTGTFLQTANNLSDVTATTARTNLGLGTAAVKAASGSGGTVASVTGSFTAGHMATFADTSGTVQDGGAAAVGWSTVNYTSNTTPATLGSTTNEVTLVAQGTPAALTINLPTSPTNGLLKCVKDKANTFATNNATVKTTDSSTIDGVAGATGYVMNQTKQQTCFISDGTNWFIQ